MSLLALSGTNSVSGGYEIDNSLKFEADNSESMSRTPSSNGNLKTCTLSVWLKRTELKNAFYFSGDYAGAANPWFILGFFGDRIYFSTTAGVSAGGEVRPNRLFRDTSAWYHIVVACDTTQSTAADRVKMYVNGVQETSFLVANYPNQNDDLDIMAAKAQGIGGYNDGIDYFYSGYMSEFVGIDGQQLDPTSFGEFDDDSGIWKPKDVSGLTFGTNGFYLDFEDASNLGNDASGGLDFTQTNITSADQATDTPTNNFCTLNQVMLTQANTVISQGATSLFSTGASGNTVVGTMGVSRGKWYWEFKHISSGGTAYWSAIGYTSSESTDSTQTAGGGSGYPSHVALLPNGGTYSNGTIFGSKFNTFSPNDIAGVALDMDNGDMYLYKNGTIQNSGNPIFTSIGDFAMPVGSVYLNGCGGYFNFGGFTSYTPSSAASDENGYGTFEYAPPSGYYALCTKNLAEYG